MQRIIVRNGLALSDIIAYIKGTRYKNRCHTHDRVLRTSVNYIHTKVFCPLMCFLFVCSVSCFNTFGRIDWVGWRLTRGDVGQATRVTQEIPQYLVQNDCDSSPFNHQPILMKGHIMGTTQNLKFIPFYY